MTITVPDLAVPIARYAQRLHAVIGDGHHVASPLGAWLLLALACPASTGQDRATLTEMLGCEGGQAAQTAADLLTREHPLVAAAAAVWNEPGAVSAEWLAQLPAAVQTGTLPDQAELDTWALDHTFGLIEKFPIQVDPSVYVILATALATRVSWECPFELAPASALGPVTPWAKRLTRVLRAPQHHSHTQFIAATPDAGDVAVHTASARGGLLVASVAAAPEVAAADVLAAAHALATACATGGAVERRSLFDLPLGDGPAWSVREEMSQEGGGQEFTAVLPAWSANSTHDLRDPRLGFGAAARAIAGPDPWQAKQAAMARYTRIGFEAAAVTALAVYLSMRAPSRGLRRTAELRFGHPFAVVAVTVDENYDRNLGRPRAGPWHGVPVFSAWVAEPQDADDGLAADENPPDEGPA
jgi:translation initiation factor 1 (eIF-1/SUI1)